MTNKLYKFEIDAPAAANKVSSLLMALDKSQGSMFRIEKAWIGFPNRDAIATGDAIGFQISQEDQQENAAFIAIDDKNEVFTWQTKSTFTQIDAIDLPDSNVVVEIPGISGTLLETNRKNYLNQLCTGQAAADVAAVVKLLGQYVSTAIEDWNDNKL